MCLFIFRIYKVGTPQAEGESAGQDVRKYDDTQRTTRKAQHNGQHVVSVSRGVSSVISFLWLTNHFCHWVHCCVCVMSSLLASTCYCFSLPAFAKSAFISMCKLHRNTANHAALLCAVMCEASCLFHLPSLPLTPLLHPHPSPRLQMFWITVP